MTLTPVDHEEQVPPLTSALSDSLTWVSATLSARPPAAHEHMSRDSADALGGLGSPGSTSPEPSAPVSGVKPIP